MNRERKEALEEAASIADRIGETHAHYDGPCSDGKTYQRCDMETHRANGCFSVAAAIRKLINQPVPAKSNEKTDTSTL